MHDNTHRAARIPPLLSEYERLLGETPGPTDPLYIASVMADFRHWCEQNGTDFDDLLALSAEHFADESPLLLETTP